MRLFWLFLTLATTLTTALRSGTAKTPANAILLSKVKTLTVRAGKQTTARRVSSIPQLKCIGGNARPLYEVDVMQCKNTGSDYGDEDVQWSCKASLPPEFKLGSTDVICEGYDSPDDPYVLKGSCGVEYRLVLTEAGEAKYGAGHDDEEGGLGQSTKNLIFWGFCICMGLFRSCCISTELTTLSSHCIHLSQGRLGRLSAQPGQTAARDRLGRRRRRRWWR